jgi:hypothetical protein
MKRNTGALERKSMHEALKGIAMVFAICAWPSSSRPQNAAVNYEEPAHLTGNIYPMGGESGKILFKSERRATRSGEKVEVTREFTYPDGVLAVQEHFAYESGRLSSFEEHSFQTGDRGSVVIRPDPRDPARQRLYFEYTTGHGAEAKKTAANEALDKDTLIDDMIPAFIAAHWDALQIGQAAKFRYIVLWRKETVGFKLIKESETTWKGIPVVRIKMEPTSFVIAQLVEPLLLVVEKHGEHRILEYIGRVSPKLKSGNKWKNLDAVSVFEWN